MKSRWSIVYIEDLQDIIFKNYQTSFSDGRFVLANSVDPDEMPHKWHFIWVFTDCHCTYLGVPSPQRIINKLLKIQVIILYLLSQSHDMFMKPTCKLHNPLCLLLNQELLPE